MSKKQDEDLDSEFKALIKKALEKNDENLLKEFGLKDSDLTSKKIFWRRAVRISLLIIFFTIDIILVYICKGITSC